MIVYDLQCSGGHTFEGWFEDRKAFLKQQKQGLIACPICNDTQIVQIPATFSIKGTPAPQRADSSQPDPQILARGLAQYMEKNFDNVGSDFAKEALKIHYGVCEPRNIRGVSTPQEEETLRHEGVEFFKFPMPAFPSDKDSDADTEPDSDQSPNTDS
jgi:hypothetical protein